MTVRIYIYALILRRVAQEPHPRSVQHAKAKCLAFPNIPLFSLHRDSVWTACRRLERMNQVCMYTELPRHTPGRIFSRIFGRLNIIQGLLFDTAFWPITTWVKFPDKEIYVRYLQFDLSIILWAKNQDHRPINNAKAASRRGLQQPSLHFLHLKIYIRGEMGLEL